MMKIKIPALLVASAISAMVFAQSADNNRNISQNSGGIAGDETFSVPATKVGECQALVIVPAKFEPKTQQVLVKEAAETIKIIPAQYEWIEQQVMVKPAGEKLEVVPATYKTVEEEIEVEPATIEKEVIEPQFAEIQQEIVSKPAYRDAENVRGVVASSGEVMRLIEKPAENKTINKKVVQEKVQVKENPVEAKYVTVQKQVIDQPAEVRKVPFEAEYKNVKVKKLVTPAQEERQEIPAEYAEVTVYDKVSDAQMRWEPVLCESTVNQATIEDVQRALNSRGYDAGVVDGAMGPSTRNALEKYQRDNKLAVGGVTMETLESLGLK